MREVYFLVIVAGILRYNYIFVLGQKLAAQIRGQPFSLKIVCQR